jgi:hypothetical protein
MVIVMGAHLARMLRRHPHLLNSVLLVLQIAYFGLRVILMLKQLL